jgi:preprotein translocase subunit SecG
MIIALTIVHVLASLAIILVVLLQSGKGADIGAAFGGGSSQTVFGGRGASTFLTKVTSGVAAAFLLTSLVLSVLGPTRATSTIIGGDAPAPAAPAAPPAPGGAPAPAQPAPPAGSGAGR